MPFGEGFAAQMQNHGISVDPQQVVDGHAVHQAVQELHDFYYSLDEHDRALLDALLSAGHYSHGLAEIGVGSGAPDFLAGIAGHPLGTALAAATDSLTAGWQAHQEHTPGA
jgi:hypothetical protein